MMFPSAVVSLDEQHNVGRSCSRDEDEDNSDDEDGVGRSSNGQSSRSSTSLSSSNSTNTDFAISSNTDNNNNYTENGNNNNNHKNNNNNNNNNNDSNNNNNNNHNNNNNLIWYFSYGSNMNPNVFEKKRNITPKQTRVCYVPDYVLTFGEGALPYVEPAFCTCIRRTELTKLQLLATATAAADTAADNTADSTISKVLAVDDNRRRRRHSRRRPDIHGVAFLITKREYEHVLMTEGGWGWQEYRNNKLWNVGHYGSEEVNCIEIINNEQTATTTITSGNNGNDSGRKFKAYTLTGIMGDVRQRYDCNASKRYYDIVIDGAKTSGLPISYQNYLKTNHKPFELLTHHKSLSSIKLARSICCILSIPCIIMEIGSLSLCIKWNNYINGNNEQSSSGCVVNVNNNTSYYSIRRPPWIICKISYLYRYSILEILLSIIIEDIFNIPNGFKNENENNNDMIEIVEIEKKKKKLKKNAVVQVVDYDVTKKVD